MTITTTTMADNTVEPIDPDFPPIRVEPWLSMKDQHDAHVAWRAKCREITKLMRMVGPSTAKTREGFFHRGMFIDKGGVTRRDLDHALPPGFR